TGLIVWWPVRRNYRHRFWPASLHRTELLRTHRNTGIWSVLPIAVLSLSGAAMIFNTEATTLLHGLFGGENASPIVVDKSRDNGHAIDWQVVLAAGKTRFPEATPRIASWESQSVARIRYKQPSEWHPNGRSVLYYRAGEGVIDQIDAAEARLGTKINHAMYPVHSARIGGPLYAAVVALTGLGLASLGFFGAWSFLKKPGRQLSFYSTHRVR
ncbi:MAG: PepSY domain-containing protein, partial [Pseudomonadales bacterium]|nr:PepSY domain-containing protein [Pseudomonadales bacterium]